MAKFVRFIRVFFSILVAIAPNLYANEWLLSRDNANRTKQLGPYNTPNMQIQKPTQYTATDANLTQNANLRANPNAIHTTNPRLNHSANPNANPPQKPTAQNCWIRRCIHHSQQPYPKQTPQARFSPQIQAQAQITPKPKYTPESMPQIAPKPESTPTTTPLQKSKPESKPKSKALRDSRLDSSANCDELENPCGDYECIYQIGACRKSAPKINSKPQPKAWIDEMRLLDSPF